MCGVGNVQIWLTYKGNGAGYDTTRDWGPWCKCNWLVENQSILIRQLCKKSRPKMIGWSSCLQIMNCCWNLVGNSREHIVVPRGLTLLLSAPFILYACVWTNTGLGCYLSKHVFDIQEIVAPVSNREMVLLLLIVTRKVAGYFILLNLTSILSSACHSHFESEEDSM